jgi:hypothetical protein
MWNSYSVSADVGGFTASGDGTTTAIAVLAGDSRHEVLLSMSAGFYQVNVGYLSDEPFATGDLPDAASYHVNLQVAADGVTITVAECRQCTEGGWGHRDQRTPRVRHQSDTGDRPAGHPIAGLTRELL